MTPGGAGGRGDQSPGPAEVRAALRLRTDAAKRYKRVNRATPLIWKLLLVGEKRFRRLNAPHLLRDVYRGVTFVDGVKAATKEDQSEEAAA